MMRLVTVLCTGISHRRL